MEVMEHVTPTRTRLSIRARLTGLLMLAVAVWMVVGWIMGLKHIASEWGLGLGGLMPFLLSSGHLIPGFGFPFLLPNTRVAMGVALLCVVALGVAALAAFVGRRWALVLSAGAAAVASGIICMDALELPWRHASGLALEALCLLVLMALPFWFGSRPARHRRIALFIVGLLAYWTTVGIAYHAVLDTYTDANVRALTLAPLATAWPNAAAQRIPCRWGPERRVCVPVAYKLLTSNKSLTAWRTDEGATIVVDALAPVFVNIAHLYGVRKGFNFERAVWDTHSYPGDLVIVKQMSRPDGTSSLYTWSSRASRGFVSVGKQKHSKQWAVIADVYPATGKPYTVSSRAAARRQALQPILASFASPPS